MTHRFLIAALAALILPIASSAANPSPDDQAADIARVEAYLSDIPSIVADFNQVSPDGSTTGGKFLLKRPGKMRWQYDKPSNLLLVSDGKVVTFYDPSVEQVSYIPVDSTMASFLARKDIRFESESTHLTKFESANGVVRATLVQKARPDEGSLSLELADKPLQLKQMTVTDATGQVTTVSLANAQFGPVLEDKLFKFIDPRGKHGGRTQK